MSGCCASWRQQASRRRGLSSGRCFPWRCTAGATCAARRRLARGRRWLSGCPSSTDCSSWRTRARRRKVCLPSSSRRLESWPARSPLTSERWRPPPFASSACLAGYRSTSRSGCSKTSRRSPWPRLAACGSSCRTTRCLTCARSRACASSSSTRSTGWWRRGTTRSSSRSCSALRSPRPRRRMARTPPRRRAWGRGGRPSSSARR
mmetsp:Transcript_25648/g.54444  ORF Transcript_25648/g.54444 Transcript_25648/m.54444 type:complete len:205 (+) Transcript_25648:298-912(+)